MSEMVERVAQAIWSARHPGLAWTSVPCVIKRSYRSGARAAIQAMREPTEEMIQAAWAEVLPGHVWRAMIDTALGADHDPAQHA